MSSDFGMGPVVSARRKYTDNFGFSALIIIGIFVMQGLPNFLTRDLVTPNSTLSIFHCLRPMGVGPIRDGETIESLLSIAYSDIDDSRCDSLQMLVTSSWWQNYYNGSFFEYWCRGPQL